MNKFVCKLHMGTLYILDIELLTKYSVQILKLSAPKHANNSPPIKGNKFIFGQCISKGVPNMSESA